MSGEHENVPGRIRAWWLEYIADRQSSKARALRARLRRGTAIEALSQREVFFLADRLGLREPGRIYRLARVFAEVEQDSPRSLAQQLGGDPPVLSEARFQRLLRADDDELVTALVRAVRMADGRCNVATLGRDLFYWSDPVRTRWTFHYFGAVASETNSEETGEIPA